MFICTDYFEAWWCLVPARTPVYFWELVWGSPLLISGYSSHGVWYIQANSTELTQTVKLPLLFTHSRIALTSSRGIKGFPLCGLRRIHAGQNWLVSKVCTEEGKNSAWPSPEVKWEDVHTCRTRLIALQFLLPLSVTGKGNHCGAYSDFSNRLMSLCSGKT